MINQPRRAMEADFPSLKDDFTWGFFVSIYLLGGVLGGLFGFVKSAYRRLPSLSGNLASKFGRRPTLLCNNATFFASSILFYSAGSVSLLCVSRFISGFGSGLATALVPTYALFQWHSFPGILLNWHHCTVVAPGGA